ncbi:MAG: hypothetical protein JWN13_1845 [Betaproteobacteria bacterium]|nr:hypothetical protein [Betaproteobacteria bacterium]
MDNNTFAFTIKQFCKAHGFSRSLYYTLKKKHQAPATIRAGRRVLITAAAAHEWREAMSSRGERDGR